MLRPAPWGCTGSPVGAGKDPPGCHQAMFGACCHEYDTLYHQERQVGDQGCSQQCHCATHALSLRVAAWTGNGAALLGGMCFRVAC